MSKQELINETKQVLMSQLDFLINAEGLEIEDAIREINNMQIKFTGEEESRLVNHIVNNDGLEITKIPSPREILKGDWYGIVYMCETRDVSLEKHNQMVEDFSLKVREEFNSNNHWSTSLRFVKKETNIEREAYGYIYTIIQFRVRDSF